MAGASGAWIAKTSDKGQWIQVDLGKIKEVTKVGIQGRQDYPQWVTKYRVSYSTDGQHFMAQNQVSNESLFRSKTCFSADSFIIVRCLSTKYILVAHQKISNLNNE